MKGVLKYTIYYTNVFSPGKDKGEGIAFDSVLGISQREAEDFIEKLRLNPDIKWVAATFTPDPVQI